MPVARYRRTQPDVVVCEVRRPPSGCAASILVVFAVGAAIAYWQLILVPIVAFVCVLLATRLFRRWCDRQSDEIAAQDEAERLRIATLIRHADEEHRLVQQGDVAGVYGSYPPPRETRGMGIWLTDKS